MLRSLILISIALFVSACRTAPPVMEMDRNYTFVILRSGEGAAKKDAEERKKIQAAHMANINRLAKEGVLLVAGPFGQPNPDPTQRGIFIFDASEIARAEEFTNTDPAVQAGVLAMELIPLRTRAPLRHALAVDLQVLADFENKKIEKYPMHNYTLAIVGGGEKAHAALVRNIAPGRVLFVGALGGALDGSSLAILDAPDAARSEEMLAPIRSELGALNLTPWWASETLTRLPEWMENEPGS